MFWYFKFDNFGNKLVYNVMVVLIICGLVL